MIEPTNHLTQLSLAQRARLYAYHGEVMQFSRYASAADLVRKTEARIEEIKALAPDGYLALGNDEAEVLGLTRMAA